MHMPAAPPRQVPRATLGMTVCASFACRGESDGSSHPECGGTVWASEIPAQIAMLCRTWQIGGAAVRGLLRTFAGLSVSKAEGILTRRYTPQASRGT